MAVLLVVFRRLYFMGGVVVCLGLEAGSGFVDPGVLFWRGVSVGAGRKHRSRGPSERGHVPLNSEIRSERKTAFAGDKDQGERSACGGHQDDNADRAIGAGDAVLG